MTNYSQDFIRDKINNFYIQDRIVVDMDSKDLLLVLTTKEETPSHYYVRFEKVLEELNNFINRLFIDHDHLIILGFDDDFNYIVNKKIRLYMYNQDSFHSLSYHINKINRGYVNDK